MMQSPPDVAAPALSKRLNQTGDAASPVALARLAAALPRTQGPKAPPAAAVKSLKRAVAAIRAQDYAKATSEALAALKTAERWGLAWHVLAIAREKDGALDQALTAYETALKLAPDETALARDLGRLAQRLGYLDLSEKFLIKALAQDSAHEETINNLACVLRDKQRYEDAVAVLTDALQAKPEAAGLWNTLGTVLTDQGRMQESVVFFDEALRLEPGNHKALYNRANARLALGEREAALVDIEAALPKCTDAFETATMTMAKALVQLMLGDLEAGFETYQVRFDRRMKDALAFAHTSREWSPETPVKGEKIIVFGEQGLGDEVLFGNVLPDLIDDVGPDGAVTLAVERRLVSLFQRSFPTATVLRHHTVRHAGRLARAAVGAEGAPPSEIHAPMASLFRKYRRSNTAFPNQAFLRADLDQVRKWTDVLDSFGPGLKVGILWKSLKLDGHRARYYSPFELWQPVLETPGVRFVNLQYGDCAQDIADARSRGFEIAEPELDLKDDLDGVAALSCALDLVIGPANATTNIAGACGAPVWLISTPDHWPSFGTDTWPCYPSATVFPADGFGDWEGVMGRIADALAERTRALETAA